ncbi:MAG: hypothetical protein ABJN96_16325 [Marinomonas sp.]
MIKVENDELIQFRSSSLGKLIRIVCYQFKHSCSEKKLIYSTFGREPSIDQINELCPEYFDRTITATVFTGMVIEALLYDYAVVRCSKTYAEKVSRKPIDIEFAEIVRDILSNEGCEESEMSARLDKFRKVRVHFVHNKSTDLGKYNKEEFEYLSPDDCLQLLIDFFVYFANKDPEYVLTQVTLNQLSELQITERGF